MAKTTQIHGAEKPIIKVFSSDYAFQIPHYQRPYSWTIDETQKLVEDLSHFAFKSKQLEETKPYFLGSVVLIKEDNKPEAKVVDGQQRLTTITILLSVLRSLMPTADLKRNVTEVIYERGNKIAGTEDRFRLYLRKQDQTFFNQYIQAEGGLATLPKDLKLPDSQSRIRDNARFLITYIQSKYSDDQITHLTQYLTQKCFLVVVSTSDDDSAFRIFSVLNDRGMQLSHADILKAEIIGVIDERNQEKYAKLWEDTESDLGIDQFKDLFSHIRMIAKKVKQRDTILAEIREAVQPSNDPTDFIDKKLIPYAGAFASIKKSDFEATSNADSINQLTYWLRLIDNEDWIPPAIIGFSNWAENNTATLLAFLKKLERLACCMSVLRFGINERLERYGKLLTELESGKEVFSPDSSLELSQVEINKFLVKLLQDVYGEKYAKYLLLRLDRELGGGVAYYDLDNVSIEHVLPQNPEVDGYWMKIFPDQKIRETKTDIIGNLLLLSRRKNSAASNYDFDKKKEKYFSVNGVSPFAITTVVLKTPKWDVDVIDIRTKEMIDLCRRIWSL